jgi:FkbM family methyltransferase
LKPVVQRLGYDLIRHPSPRLLRGQTRLLLEELEVDCIFDVGANTGQYGKFVRGLGYDGAIISFEPVASTFAELQSVAVRDEAWITLNMALGAHDGQVTINVTSNTDLASMLTPTATDVDGFDTLLAVKRTETVDVCRLDTIIDQYAPGASRAFLKMDTQGWDLKVLEGAVGSLRRIVAIQSELSVVPLYDEMATWLDSLTVLKDLGYDPIGFFPVIQFDRLRPLEFDCLMVRRSAPHEDGTDRPNAVSSEDG